MPPLTGTAVKLTLLPVQSEVPGFALMLTEASSAGLLLTVMVTESFNTQLPDEELTTYLVVPGGLAIGLKMLLLLRPAPVQL